MTSMQGVDILKKEKRRNNYNKLKRKEKKKKEEGKKANSGKTIPANKRARRG